MNNNSIASYSPGYIDEIFFHWYRLGRPSAREFLTFLKSTMEKVPTVLTINKWREAYGWDSRADILDIEVTRQIETKAIQEKVEMMKRHAEIGKKLQDKGLEFLENNEIVQANAAIKAIIQGSELERASRGIPDAMLKVAEMRDEELTALVSRLMSKNNPIKEAEHILQEVITPEEPEEPIEGDFTDEPK